MYLCYGVLIIYLWSGKKVRNPQMVYMGDRG